MIIDIITTNFKYLLSLPTMKGNSRKVIRKYLGIDEKVPVNVGIITQKNEKNQ